MADSFLTLSDVLQINDQNLADLNVSDLLDDAPLIARMAAIEASNGTEHKYLKQTGAPVVGFRAPNTGRENSKSTDTLVTISLKILDASFAVDKALADSHSRGPEALVAREARRHLRASFAHAEKQLIYGTGNEADGFTALADNAGLNGLADAMVIGAGGTTAGTGSSIWLIRTNDTGDAAMVAGNDGQIEIGDTVVQAIEDTVNGGRFTGYYTPIEGWLGMQIGSAYSVARIANITEDAGKGATDDLIYKALELFPAARQPNLIAMSRRSLRQLRESRTATNATGAPAPRPTDVEGIPIVVTDAITNTEALLT